MLKDASFFVSVVGEKASPAIKLSQINGTSDEIAGEVNFSVVYRIKVSQYLRCCFFVVFLSSFGLLQAQPANQSTQNCCRVCHQAAMANASHVYKLTRIHAVNS